jgi:hypothetical protein
MVKKAPIDGDDWGMVFLALLYLQKCGLPYESPKEFLADSGIRQNV